MELGIGMDLGIGLIGAGVMGGDHALTLATLTKGASLVAVADADPVRASAIARLAPSARIFADGISLIDDPSVDAVLVASPDETHVGLVLACLAAGKPVLCEKPLAPTPAQCLEVVASETALGRRLVQIGFMRRFDPGYGAMRDEAASGRLGSPVFLHCAHRNAAVPPWFDGTMVITNSAVHEIDIARWLLGDEIASATVLMRSGGGPPDRQFIVLESRRGTLVDVELMLSARYGYDVTAELVLEAGTASLRSPAPQEIRREGTRSIPYAPDWRSHFAAAYRIQMQAWVDAVRAQAPSGAVAKGGADAWDGYAASAIAGACLDSLRLGQRVEVALAPRPALYG